MNAPVFEARDPTLELSVVIVNWNTCDLLRDCLSSIHSAPCGMDFEVFVVDNASTDGSAEMVERDFPQVSLIRNLENLGYARANNLAVRKCRGANILLLNSDTVIGPAILPEVVRLLRSDDSIGALGCGLVGPDGEEQQSYYFDYPDGTAVCEPGTVVGDGLIECAHVWGAFLMVRREAIEKAGLLDEDFFMFYEDVDWLWRMREAGWRIVFDPKHTVTHVCRASCDRVESYEHHRRLAHGQALLYAKHWPESRFRLWRVRHLLHHGQCVLSYRLLAALRPSESIKSKLAKHRGFHDGFESVRAGPRRSGR